MQIFTFGDSHASAGWHSIQIPFVKIYTHELGPKLMYTFGQQGLELLDIKKFPVCDGDTIVFCFGEIDVRHHIGKFTGQKFEDIIDALIDNYFMAVNANVSQFTKLKTWIYFIPPVLPVYGTDGLNTVFPCRGTDENRKQYALYMNKRLSEECVKFGYTFVDIYDQYCDEFGFLKESMRWDVHIKNPQPLIDFIKRELL